MVPMKDRIFLFIITIMWSRIPTNMKLTSMAGDNTFIQMVVLMKKKMGSGAIFTIIIEILTNGKRQQP